MNILQHDRPLESSADYELRSIVCEFHFRLLQVAFFKKSVSYTTHFLPPNTNSTQVECLCASISKPLYLNDSFPTKDTLTYMSSASVSAYFTFFLYPQSPLFFPFLYQSSPTIALYITRLSSNFPLPKLNTHLDVKYHGSTTQPAPRSSLNYRPIPYCVTPPPPLYPVIKSPPQTKRRRIFFSPGN